MALFFLCFALTGCSGKEDYSEQSYDIMATYISQAIMKYDKNMDYKLEHLETPKGDVEDEDNKEPENEPQQEPEKEPEISEDDEEKESKPLEEVLGTVGFKFTYKDSKIVDNYSDGKYCNIQPCEGMKICIITYELKNTSGKDGKVVLLPEGKFYKLISNGTTYTALHTILDNDIHYLDLQYKAEESKDVVLVFEVDEKDIDSEKNINISSDVGVYTTTVK